MGVYLLLIASSSCACQSSVRFLRPSGVLVVLLEHLCRLRPVLIGFQISLIFFSGFKILPMHAIGVQIERLVEDLVRLLGRRLCGTTLSTIQWLRHVELPNQLYIRI